MTNQPLEILLELVQKHKLDPWDVDIKKLIWISLSHLDGMEKSDLRILGRTLLSASILLRMKSEQALGGKTLSEGEREELPDLPELGQMSIMRHTLHAITLSELADALKDALKKIPLRKPGPKKRLERAVQTLTEYYIDIEKHLEKLYQRIEALIVSKRKISLFELIDERTRLSIARTFFSLLFLSDQSKVVLHQEDPFGEIYVELRTNS